MQHRFFVVPVLVGALCAATGTVASAQLKLPRPSPKATVTQTIGITDLSVTYSRPGVKGRKIWGDLVPYAKPWRTGANEATAFKCTDEIQLGGKKLPAGEYFMHTVPGEKEWTVVLNSDKNMAGTPEYKADKEVLRFTVTPAAAGSQEWMGFTFENLTPQSADLVLRWEKLAVSMPIKVDVNAKALVDARAAVTKAEEDAWLTPYQAASFTLNNDVGMAEGEQWLAKSLSIEENYYNLNLLARWRMKQGRKPEAIAAAQKAITKAKESKDDEDTAPTEKLLTEWMAAK